MLVVVIKGRLMVIGHRLGRPVFDVVVDEDVPWLLSSLCLLIDGFLNFNCENSRFKGNKIENVFNISSSLKSC